MERHRIAPALLALAWLFFPNAVGAETEPSTWGKIKAQFEDRAAEEQKSSAQGAGQYWGNNVVSEAFYSLNLYRTGSSNVIYHNLVMSDWNYVESDRNADKRVSWWIGGCGNRGGAGGTVTFRDWNGGYDVCHRGGYCKYFVNLVLYRSSYGWGGGQHLVLPSGYSYATGSVYAAQPGWVLQSSAPHTAIVVRVMPGGLDVVDSNSTGGNGNFAISRHEISWSTLNANGYRAYNPWANPTLIPEAGPTTPCF